jgi:hypothetical protein
VWLAAQSIHDVSTLAEPTGVGTATSLRVRQRDPAVRHIDIGDLHGDYVAELHRVFRVSMGSSASSGLRTSLSKPSALSSMLRSTPAAGAPCAGHTKSKLSIASGSGKQDPAAACWRVRTDSS